MHPFPQSARGRLWDFGSKKYILVWLDIIPVLIFIYFVVLFILFSFERKFMLQSSLHNLVGLFIPFNFSAGK